MEPERYAFRGSDLVGGHVVLDLVNTVTGRRSSPTDWLDSYDRVLEWAALTDEFDAETLQTLDRLHTANARAASPALERLRSLREAVYEIVVAALHDGPAPEGAVTRLERHWKEATVAARLTLSRGRPTLEFDVRSSGLDYPTHVLALSALAFLQTLPLDRTRECASPPCTWIFVDRSRGGQRRWCDMATCGNAAKSRRHYERRRTKEAR
jgi:predicted RNA-binding Zn ribbon-like protein